MRILRVPNLLAATAALTAATAVAATALPSPASASPVATAAATCDISKVATTLGPTEVTSLKATKVSCKDAIKLVKAFHVCRMANGPAGRCVKKVRGYACGEVRNGPPTAYTSRVTCRKAKASVVHTYRQTS